MEWLPKVNLGDLQGAVSKFSESVKNIEKNFDSALGFDGSFLSQGTPGDAGDAAGRPPLSTSIPPPPPVSVTVPTPSAPSAPVTQEPKQTVLPSSDVTPTLPTLPSIPEPPATEKDDQIPNVEAQIEQPEKLQLAATHRFPSLSNDMSGNLAADTPLHQASLSLNRTTEEHQEVIDSNLGPEVEIAKQKPSPSEAEEPRNAEIIPDGQVEPAQEGTLQLAVQVISDDAQPSVMEKESSNLLAVAPLQGEQSISTEKSGEGLKEPGEAAQPPPAPQQEKLPQTEAPPREASSVPPISNVEAASDSSTSVKEPTLTVEDAVLTKATTSAQEQREGEEGLLALVTEEVQVAPLATTGANGVARVHEPEKSTTTPLVELLEEVEGVQKKTEIAAPPPSSSGSKSRGDQGEGSHMSQRELQGMEESLQAAAKQAQVKANELARYMAANDELKAQLSQLKAKRAGEAELDVVREEYQHRLSAAERKVYALTKERDMLRREQGRKNDSTALLKEKDEIIKQVMAEGEELSKRQATQEAQMKKLRTQIRELEEEKQRVTSRLQVEEARSESIRRDKTATEQALQEAVERAQADMAAQKEFYASQLAEAKAAQAAAEAQADSQARSELDRRLRDAADREAALLATTDDLRQTLTRTQQQVALREERMRGIVEDLERRCQDADARHEDLVARMPDSTRPLLRQIEAMQESAALRAEALSGVERALNARLQDAEAAAAASQERERAAQERLSQALSRMAVMEAQLACLRAEHAQLTRSLEKERQRCAELRQDALASQEAAAVQEGRARQLDQELKAERARHRRDLTEERQKREALEQEIEMERAATADQEKRGRPDKADAMAGESMVGGRLRRLPSVSSGGSVEESAYLAASLQAQGSSEGGTPSGLSLRLSHSGKSLLTSAALQELEALLRSKEGELASYANRLVSLEATRDSLAEELVSTTQQCEGLRNEVGVLPGLRAELDALRRRHASALELMGERDEQVEELRADLADIKEMYREQIDMLVNQIERLSGAVASK